MPRVVPLIDLNWRLSGAAIIVVVVDARIVPLIDICVVAVVNHVVIVVIDSTSIVATSIAASIPGLVHGTRPTAVLLS